ncbi:MAG: PDZ domain-containing protein [Saprospiraceae bacterium]|nr:PDZ domain-containing protein [Saprospiraceae bacterium]MCB9325820.1 PDZ domain-containing protein [Lewinellaceae bacterium]
MEKLSGNDNNRGLKIWMPLLLAAALVGGLLIGLRLQRPSPVMVLNNDEAGQSLGGSSGRVEELIRYIEARYVDEVDKDKLTDIAIQSIIDQLDPHSSYIPAKELQEVNDQLDGDFDGIGVEFFILDDTLLVVSPLAGGPSETAGILAGDKIVTIEDSIVAGKDKNVRQITGMLRGEKGTQVKVGVLRGHQKDIMNFTITRDAIPMNSVDVAMMLDDKTGYIRLSRFSAKTYEEFMKAMEPLIEEHKMKDLVIDLRGNPGGYLQQATRILSQLFKDKQALLVFTEGRKTGKNEYNTSGMPFYDINNIVVLIDEGSASASEIVAGAIQDRDRGIIVGRRSFGKGLVQEQYELSDGSALRLTVARYYTPSGRSIQKPYDDKEGYAHDFIDRMESGELSDVSHIIVSDSTQYHTSNGHVVYGGGGIIPDVYVPLDTSLYSDTYAALRQELNRFVYRYMENPGIDLSEYTLKTFKKDFQISDALFNNYVSFVKEDGTPIDDTSLAHCKEDIKNRLKAQIARQLFKEEGFYSILFERDMMIKEALRVLRLPDPLAASRGEE